MVTSQFTGDEALGGAGTDEFSGSVGGAIDNYMGATLTVTASTFSNNQALGAAGPFFGIGGAFDNNNGSVATSATPPSVRTWPAGTGSTANGGALDDILATMSVVNCSFTGNDSIGGADPNGTTTYGQGIGGAISAFGPDILTVIDSSFAGNLAMGGSGGTQSSLPLLYPSRRRLRWRGLERRHAQYHRQLLHGQPGHRRHHGHGSRRQQSRRRGGQRRDAERERQHVCRQPGPERWQREWQRLGGCPGPGRRHRKHSSRARPPSRPRPSPAARSSATGPSAVPAGAAPPAVSERAGASMSRFTQARPSRVLRSWATWLRAAPGATGAEGGDASAVPFPWPLAASPTSSLHRTRRHWPSAPAR